VEGRVGIVGVQAVPVLAVPVSLLLMIWLVVGVILMGESTKLGNADIVIECRGYGSDLSERDALPAR
jgi:hypothetical protein